MAAAGIRMKKNTNLLICTCEKRKKKDVAVRGVGGDR